MPSDPSTYAGLKTSLADNWLKRTDLSTNEIPEAIALFERRAQRIIFCPEREEVSTSAVSTGSVALPSDFWGLKTLYVDGTTDTVLTRAEPSDLIQAYPDGTTGTPSHYAVEGEALLLRPIPSSSVTLRLTYWKTVAALSDANTTNWLLTDHPDVYLWGSLLELYSLLGDDKAAGKFLAKLDASVNEINLSGRRRTANSGPLRATHSIRHARNIRA